MKAVLIDSYGSFETLRYTDAVQPNPRGDELLVKVKASSINPVDWKICRGDFKVLSGNRFPKKLGCDFAGIVQDVGGTIQDYQPGDEVYGFINPLQGGAYAQYLTVKARQVAPKSPHITFEQAAAIPVAGLTAWQALSTLGKIQAGMKVLINGASGGVGTFAVQIAQALSADVTGVCREENLALVQKIGAKRTIDYTKQGFVEENFKYDIIFDVVGNRTFAQCRPLLTNKGIYITTLPNGGNIISVLISSI